MIVSAAVCPHPPVLFRELGGRDDVALELREACVDAVVAATEAGVERLVLVGGADATGWCDPALPEPVAGFLGRAAEGPTLPLSLGVGCRLVEESGWDGPLALLGVAWDATFVELADLAAELADDPTPTALLVLGDGSARRGEKAPGYVDERAFAVDESLATALATGDVQALVDLDPALAAELMVSGRAAFRLLAAAVERRRLRVEASLRYGADPFGVMYFVASWRCLAG